VDEKGLKSKEKMKGPVDTNEGGKKLDESQKGKKSKK
jgi:hypothetical protein